MAYSTKPFKGNNDGEKNRTVENDVVDWVENLWEEDGINFTAVREWPLKHFEKSNYTSSD